MQRLHSDAVAAPDCTTSKAYLLVEQQLIDSLGTHATHQMPLKCLLSRLVPCAEPGAVGIKLQTLKSGLKCPAAGLPASSPGLKIALQLCISSGVTLGQICKSMHAPSHAKQPDTRHWAFNMLLTGASYHVVEGACSGSHLCSSTEDSTEALLILCQGMRSDGRCQGCRQPRIRSCPFHLLAQLTLSMTQIKHIHTHSQANTCFNEVLHNCRT